MSGYRAVGFVATFEVLLLAPFAAAQQVYPAQPPALPGCLLGITSVAEALAADMDGDGHQDLVTFSNSPTEIRIHLGNGAGAFVRDAVPSVSAPEPTTPRSGITADFDGDGDLDLALLGGTTQQGSFGRLFTWTNDGTGVLKLQSTWSFQKEATNLTAIDVEGDGWTDLLILRKGSPYLHLLRSLGPAGFSAPQPIDLPSGSTGMSTYAVGDLDRDGRPDILTVNTGSLTDPFEVFLHSNDGLGGFHAPVPVFEVAQSTNQLLLADLRGDGVLHAASYVQVQQESTLSWYENDGSGSFRPRQSFDGLKLPPSFAHDQRVCDLDGDGREEWVVQLPSGFSGRLVAQDSRVVLAPGEFVVPESDWLTAGDFDSDGAEDLVSRSWSAATQGSLCLMLSDGTGGQRGTIVSGSVPNGISKNLVDFDDDGRLDLVLQGSSAKGLHLLRGLRGARFEWTQTIYPRGAISQLASGDFDGDGRTDLAMSEGAQPVLELFLQGPRESFSSVGTTTPFDFEFGYGLDALHTLDSDGDGRDEIAYYDLPQRSVIVVGLNDEASVRVLGRIQLPEVKRINGVTDAPPGMPQALELIAPGTSSFQSLWVLAHPFGRTPPKLFERLALPQPALLPDWAEQLGPFVADFDGDGQVEVWSTRYQYAGPNPTTTSVWTALPTGGFGTPQADRSPYPLSPSWSGDIDGDGAADRVYDFGVFDDPWIPGYYGTQVHRPAQGEPLAVPELYTWSNYAHGDVNGDGRTDLVMILNGKVVTLLGGAGR